MSTPMTGTRLDEETERRLAASVERRGVSRSEWLREVISNALAAEGQAADHALAIKDMTTRFLVFEEDLRQTRSSVDESLRIVEELSKATAMERAADRAVAQQVYRMAFRSAYLVLKQFTDEVSEEQRDDLGADLCAECDHLYSDIGLARLDQVMRDAREELREGIERGGWA